ncbi:hypothetical protein, partial [Salmonella enterica]|uniref:hypothetical protein n=1 Tax=Salmonella enterica TaxID=28901 RepID=UPI00398C2773
LVAQIGACCPMHETGARMLIAYIEHNIQPRLQRAWLQARQKHKERRTINIGKTGRQESMVKRV